jgi:hypothetical protein
VRPQKKILLNRGRAIKPYGSSPAQALSNYFKKVNFQAHLEISTQWT